MPTITDRRGHVRMKNPSPDRKPAPEPLHDPDVPKGMSIELLQDLHLLTREGKLNADARRKLKQIRHLVGLLRPGLDEALTAHQNPTIVDCGAGKSYLGFLLYELVLGPAGRGTMLAVESRSELVEAARARARRFGHERLRFVEGVIASAEVPRPVAVVTALHACDTATDDALALGIDRAADIIAVVPCCQAEVARQLGAGEGREPEDEVLIAHPLHRRELGSHLTNVVRALCLEACGYKVTVTELVGWEHALKNELLLARRAFRPERAVRATLARLLERWKIEPSLVRALRRAGALG
jgi:Methyltransferase domain